MCAGGCTVAIGCNGMGRGVEGFVGRYGLVGRDVVIISGVGGTVTGALKNKNQNFVIQAKIKIKSLFTFLPRDNTRQARKGS